MKLLRLICISMLAAFALAACHFDNGSDASAASGSSEPLPVGDGTATVSWEAPTTTTTGAALTDLGGYRIYYGISETDLSQSIKVSGVGLQTYVIDNLGVGTWYFAVRAVTTLGVESPLSQIVSKTID